MDTAVPLTLKGVCLDVAGRVLLCRNGRGEWELPGGRPHVGETFASCLVREIGEETGLVVEVADLIAAYPYEVLPGCWVNVIVYGCEIPHPAPRQTSDEHERVAFVDLASVDDQQLAAGYRQAVRVWTDCAISSGGGWAADRASEHDRPAVQSSG